MERILVVNVNWIGDVIFSSPVFKALKEAYPKARISCLAVPRVKEILENISFIDEIIEYDEKGRHRGVFAKLRLILQLRRKRFNAAFLLHRSLTRALLVYWAGIPQRIGYDEKGRGRYLTHRSEYPAEELHRSDHYLNVIESYGVSVKDRRCQLNVSADADKKIREILKAKDIQDRDYFIVVNTGGNWDLKRWPSDRFSVLIERLMTEGKVKVVLPGAHKDIPLIKKITKPLKCEPVVLAGETNLTELIALLKRANLVVTADSGPLHMASGVNTDVIGIFGPTRPEITGPRGTGRSYIVQHNVGCNREPCYHIKCPDNICMSAVTVDDVLENIKKIRNS